MVQAGVRRNRNNQPRMEPRNKDASIVKYNVQGRVVQTDSTLGTSTDRRLYIGGYAGDVISNAGVNVVSFYSTCKYLPGTRIRWEPSCSFTTSGRVFVAFSDNPEVIETLQTLRADYEAAPGAGTYAGYAGAVKALASCMSFPVWQETDISFPLGTRRKRFDVDATPTGTVDNFERNCQQAMFACVEAGPDTSSVVGQFWYHDVVDVEGLHNAST